MLTPAQKRSLFVQYIALDGAVQKAWRDALDEIYKTDIYDSLTVGERRQMLDSLFAQSPWPHLVCARHEWRDYETLMWQHIETMYRDTLEADDGDICSDHTDTVLGDEPVSAEQMGLW